MSLGGLRSANRRATAVAPSALWRVTPKLAKIDRERRRKALRHTLLALVVGAMLNVSCGSSSQTTPATTPTQPTTPTDPNLPNLAGSWSGTLESPAFMTRDISAQIVQGGTCVDGAWKTATPEMNGAISGLTQGSASFDGFISVEGTPGASGLCLGVFRVTGSATATGIKWTWMNDGSCAGGIPQTVTFKLHK